MKQYLTSEQTAKLIELGFEKPKSISSIKVPGDIITTAEDLIGEPSSVMRGKITANYSIGELLSFLPDDGVSDKRLEFDGFHWFVDWDSFDKIHQTMQVELVDALYDMVVQLKEEGMI